MKTHACVLVMAVVFFGGCAMTDPDHMATTNWMDRTIVPDNEIAQWALTPVWVPVCLGALAVDNLIVTPVVHAPSAVEDAKGFYEEFKLGSYYGDAGLLPLRFAVGTAVSPLYLAGRGMLAVRTQEEAWWGWPEWGKRWKRDENHRLIGPAGEGGAQ